MAAAFVLQQQAALKLERQLLQLRQTNATSKRIDSVCKR